MYTISGREKGIKEILKATEIGSNIAMWLDLIDTRYSVLGRVPIRWKALDFILSMKAD